MTQRKFYLFLVLLFLNICGLTIKCFAQKDTVVVKQGDRLIGEVLSLNGDILSFKTNYSSESISIKWNEIVTLSTQSKYRISTNKGKILIGKVRIDTINNSSVILISLSDTIHRLKRTEVQEISKFGIKLSDRLKISADLGLVATKANHTDQATLDLLVKYFASRWEFDFDYSGYASSVDTIETRRANLNITTKYNFPENWFLLLRLNSFKSTEQQIDYRVNYFLGSGKYILRQHKLSTWIYGGATYNREKYTISSRVFKTLEGFGGCHLEAAPLERFNVTSDIIAYPGLSEWGRFRLYSNTNAMLNFAKHFRFGLGFAINTDNRPPSNTSKTDYLFNAKVGWTL